jgi:hypothetical protein
MPDCISHLIFVNQHPFFNLQKILKISPPKEFHDETRKLFFLNNTLLAVNNLKKNIAISDARKHPLLMQ